MNAKALQETPRIPNGNLGATLANEGKHTNLTEFAMPMSLIGYDAAAQILGVRPGTLYAWVSQERVPHIRFSARCVKFDAVELEAWAQGHRVPGSQEPLTMKTKRSTEPDRARC